MNNSKETIIFIASSILCGKNRTQFQRAKLLGNKFNTYLLVTYDICPELKKIIKVKVCPGRRYYLHLVIFPFWVIWEIFKLKQKEKINAVYTSYYPQALIAGFFAKKLGFKWIADIWDAPSLAIEIAKNYKNFYAKVQKVFYQMLHFFIKKILKKADLIILALEPEAIKEYKVDFKKVIHVTNGVSLKAIESVIKNINKKINIANKEKFTLIYVGHIMKSRGIDLILEAADRLKNKISDYQFILVGYAKEEDKNWLFKEINERELKEYVKFLGKLEHKRTLKQIIKSDVCLFLFPNSKELRYIYPIKIFEYMALGKPNIATNLKGVSRIIKNRKNGILVNNVNELVDSILELYYDKNLRSKLGHNALRDVAQYDWKRINSYLFQQITNFLEAN